MAKYQKLKELLIQIQKENKSGNSKLLNEIKEHMNSDEYKISLEQLAKEIIEESRYDKEYQQNRYSDQKQKIQRIQNSTTWGHLDGAWKKQQYEHIGDYEERVQKADSRLNALIRSLKGEVSSTYQELEKIPAISKLEDSTKQAILATLLGKLDRMVGEILETLSVYPFEWDFYEDHLGDRISQILSK